MIILICIECYVSYRSDVFLLFMLTQHSPIGNTSDVDLEGCEFDPHSGL